MKISFTDKVLEADHPVFIVSDKASKLISLGSSVDKEIDNKLMISVAPSGYLKRIR